MWGQSTAVYTFNTDAGISALGISKPASSAGTNLSTTSPYVVNGVSMSVTHGGTNTRVYNSSGTLDLRIYKNGGSLTFTASTNITSIVLAGTSVANFSANAGTFSAGTWTGSATSVTLTATNTGKINTITVTYASGGDTPTYTVTYNANGGTGTMTDNNSYEEGDEVTLLSNTFTAPSGKTWNSWSVTDGSNNTISVSNGKFTMPASNVTVSAQWVDLPTHTAHFSVNGTIDSNNDCTVAEGVSITFPANPADVNGKSFVGWVTTAINGTTNNAPSFVTSATMGNSDVTYYAVFAAVTPGTNTTVTDELTTSTFGSPTSYTSWTNKQAESGSDAVYAGNSTTSSGDGISSIQLRSGTSKNSNVHSGIVTTTSGGKAKKVTVEWDETTTSGRTLDIYGKNSAYSSQEDLYSSTTQGVKLGSIVFGTSTELTITGDYEYLGLRSNDGAMYLTSISIDWQNGTPDTYSDYCTTVAAAVAVTSVSVDATTSVNVGETTTLTATVSPDNATNKNVTWTSSDETVATVDASGVVTGVAAGTATITVTSVADNTKTATCTVTVTTVAVTGVSVDATASVGVGETTTLTATVSPNNATNKNVTWESSDNTVATVDANGVVTGVAAGTATITATSVADNTKTASCTVTVSLVPGTEARPYTVAEALTAINALEDNGTIDNKYVSGKISQVNSYNNGAITYWISDDGTTTSQLQVYKGKGLSGNDFSDVTDLEVGDAVVVNGQLKKYVSGTNTTPEFNSGSQLISIVEIQDNDLAKTGDIYLSAAALSTTANATDYFNTSSDGAITYESGNTSVATVSAEGVVTPVAEGSTYITVSQAATATYKAGEITINVIVASASLNETEILVDASGSTVYGTPKEEDYMISATYDGTVAAVSSNTAVATVAITQPTNGEGTFTITPVAVGTAVITISAPATATCEAAENVTYTITVTAPAGLETAAPAPTTVFNETFTECKSTGGNSGGFATAGNTKISSEDDYTDNDDWSFTNGYPANGCVKFGGGSSAGSAESPSITVENGKTYTLSFKAAPWSSEDSKTMTVTVTGGTINGNASATTSSMTAGQWNEFEFEIVASSTSITLDFNCSANRFFLDDVVVSSGVLKAKLNASGYGTYCSKYPLDFSKATDYSAWYITGTSGETITFEKVTGSVKGGTGLFLKGENGTTGEIELTSVNSTNTLRDNMLVGTLAPTYFEEDAIYGLSGNTFKLNYAGTFKANKAYIRASEIDNNGSGVRAFTFVFVDPTTGISETQTVSAEQFGEIFNLAGQRIDQPQKGVNIINGKKVLVK